MELIKKGNKLIIKGIIKTIEDSEKIIKELNNIESKEIEIEIIDSYVMPSSIIGHLLRLIEEGKEIKMGAKNELLYELLSDLNLDKPFNLRKI